MENMLQDHEPTTLPILIAGAGPCGLVAALTLQQRGVPFVIVEKAASKAKLTSNAGAGFDLFPTAVGVLADRLGLRDECFSRFQEYAGIYLMAMDGKLLRDVPLSDLREKAKSAPELRVLSVTRSGVQQICLEALEQRFNGDFLKCGVSVVGYDQDSKKVTAHLSDGTSMDCAALLACDGVRSALREHMCSKRGGSPPPLLYTGQICYWGKTKIAPDLKDLVGSTQKYAHQGPSFVWTLGNSKQPGSFMGWGARDVFLWIFAVNKEDGPGEETDDLTKRGGTCLDSKGKEDLLQLVQGRAPLITTVIGATPAADMTVVGFHDLIGTGGKNDPQGTAASKMPYSDGRVVLLGDAAHPQSPFSGQGVNMAIADAYVVACRIALACDTTTSDGIADAIHAYDTEERREGVNKVVREARSNGDSMCSSSWLVCWITRIIMTWMPLSWFVAGGGGPDQTNADLIKKMDLAFAASDVGTCNQMD